MTDQAARPEGSDSSDQLGLVERLRLIAAWDTPGGPTPSVKPDKMATCNEAADRVIDLTREVQSLRAALKWYADGEHFTKADPDAWDTVSGEPQNWWCDEAGTAMVEDGSLAGMVLEGKLTGQQLQALDEGEEA